VHIFKAGVLDPLFMEGCNVHDTSEFGGGFFNEILELPVRTSVRQTVVVGRCPSLELRKLNPKADVEICQLDITDDNSVYAAVEYVKDKYGKLDVLINNAAAVKIPRAADLSDFRTSWDFTLSVGVTSFALTTQAFLPLLQKSPSGKVINVSSTRGSFDRSVTGNLPPTVVVAYCVSKTALNMLTVEQQKSENARVANEEIGGNGKVRFYACSPGHMRTAFNGFVGKRDPLDGAEVVLRLLLGEYEEGTFWEFEEGAMQQVPW